MDTVVLAEVMRMIERILVVGGGIVSICLGYQLFRLAAVKQDSEGKFKASGVEFAVSRVGPGVFFALFGAYVLHASLTNSIKAGQPASISASQPAAQPVTTSAAALSKFGADIDQLQTLVAKLPAADKDSAMKLLQKIQVDLAGALNVEGFVGGAR